MDEAISGFTSFTGQTEDVARRYLGMTDNDVEQAVSLFFEAPDLGASGNDTSRSAAPPIPSSTRPSQARPNAGEESQGYTNLDSDEEMDIDDDNGHGDNDAAQAAALARAADVEDDEAMARRMQEELYAGGDASGGFDADGVRAPIARTTETLVGGPGDWDSASNRDHVFEQLRARQEQGRATAGGRTGIFNQAPSIWDDNADEETRRRNMAEATGGQSEASTKAQRLTELFRPPFDLMCRLPWDVAREKGKSDQKWLLVNIQDNSIFHCQQLNRDLWKHDGIKELVKENFLFMQYAKEDQQASQYVQYYFANQVDNDDAYPHIAIVDPRTGEQVKVWSGPPAPQPADFLMQLVEFLDRYSLDPSKKNPVARRKPEKPKKVDIDRLTEQEMLDLALQNSMENNGAGATPPKADDPDDLTKSTGDVGKGKGKAVEEEEVEEEDEEASAAASAFSAISSSNPHTEPENGPETTRIQFRHSNGRVVRRFRVGDRVRVLYEWLKAQPLEGKEGVRFELKLMGKDLIERLEETVEEAGLKNSTVMVEFVED